MRNYVIDDHETTFAVDRDILSFFGEVEKTMCSEEGFKEMWDKTKSRVLILFGNQEAMAKFINENMSKLTDLDENKLIRTVMPKDLTAAVNAANYINGVLISQTASKPADFKKLNQRVLNDVGIELREDGEFHDEKFQTGAWGEGKGKTNISKPMTFKKKVGEFGWNGVAASLGGSFVQIVRKLSKNSIVGSIDRHYADLVRSYASKAEKMEVKIDKKVALNQIRNLLTVRANLIKFIFRQLEAVMGGSKKEYDEAAKVPQNPTSDAGTNWM